MGAQAEYLSAAHLPPLLPAEAYAGQPVSHPKVGPVPVREISLLVLRIELHWLWMQLQEPPRVVEEMRIRAFLADAADSAWRMNLADF